eukprot:tig00021435_g21402.t1
MPAEPNLQPACSSSTCTVPCCVTKTGLSEEALVKAMRARRQEFFEDDAFPASERSLFRDPDRPWQGHIDLKMCQWLRPKEFCPGQPKLFIDGVEPGDVIQGMLGDCWFLGALSVLATQRHLLERLFVSTRNAKSGIYTIAVFKDEFWHTVVVDDRVLCRKDKRPLYASCKDRNELWVCLLEKAYAKVHKCYENLIAGFVDYGLKDLTGGCPETIKLEAPATKAEMKADQLWPRLRQLHSDGSLMGCSFSYQGKQEAPGESGILKGHAYGILDVRDVENGAATHRLLRLRNPWGRKEWSGAWSDGSKEWSPALLKKLSYQFADDGTFWICWDDFTRVFNTVFVCRIFTDDWHGQRVLGEWRMGESAWGCPNAGNRDWVKNRQFHLTVPTRSQVFITLSQGDVRLEGKQQFAASIGFFVLRSPGATAGERVASISGDMVAATPGPFKPARELSVAATLEAGHYKVIPMTFEKFQEASYCLVVWADRDVDLEGETVLPKFGRPPEAAGVWDDGVDDGRGEQSAPPPQASFGYARGPPPAGAGAVAIDAALIREEPAAEAEFEPAGKTESGVANEMAASLAEAVEALRLENESLRARLAVLERIVLGEVAKEGWRARKVKEPGAGAFASAPASASASGGGGASVEQARLAEAYLEECRRAGVRPNSSLAARFPEPVAGGVLDFSRGNYVGNRGLAPVLAVVQAHCPGVTRLVLRSQGLANEAAAALAAAFKGNRDLEAVDLSGNHITLGGVASLLALVQGCPALTELIVDGNDFSEKQATRIRIALENNRGRGGTAGR